MNTFQSLLLVHTRKSYKIKKRENERDRKNIVDIGA
jgi:hypothetical protein